jgi:hypothetical protein
MKTSEKRDAMAYMIDDQPIVIHRYALLSGDGVTSSFSWSWAGSWKGRKDTLGREVWFTQDGPVTARSAKRSYNVIIPYSADWPTTPKMGDRIELIDTDGNSEGVYLVNNSTEYKDGGDIWKVDLNVQESEP